LPTRPENLADSYAEREFTIIAALQSHTFRCLISLATQVLSLSRRNAALRFPRQLPMEIQKTDATTILQ
jgi:hypothetical protein